MQDTMTASHRTADRRMLILALIAGAVAAGLIVAFLASQESGGSSTDTSAVTRSVVVATGDIDVGETITSSMLELRALPEDATASAAATSFDQVVGETARYPIAAGEQLTNLRLVRPPVVQALSFQIPEGMRGFTIPVNSQSSPSALLVPGDFVDVLVAGSAGDIVERSLLTLPRPAIGADGEEEEQQEPEAVVTLLQNVQVLSVQREYVDNGVPYDPSVRGELPEEDTATYVTLALSPEDTQVLWLASQAGELTLALRAFGDDNIVDLSPVGGPVRTR